MLESWIWIYWTTICDNGNADMSPIGQCRLGEGYALHLLFVFHFHSGSSCKNIRSVRANVKVSIYALLVFLSGRFLDGFVLGAVGAFRFPSEAFGFVFSSSSSSLDSSSSSSPS